MKVINKEAIQVGVMVLGLFLVSCGGKSKDCSVKNDGLQSIEGPLTVQYNLQLTPTTTAGSSIQRVDAIHFFDHYIVVEGPESRGQVFPVEKIIEFTWRK